MWLTEVVASDRFFEKMLRWSVGSIHLNQPISRHVFDEVVAGVTDGE